MRDPERGLLVAKQIYRMSGNKYLTENHVQPITPIGSDLVAPSDCCLAKVLTYLTVNKTTIRLGE